MDFKNHKNQNENSGDIIIYDDDSEKLGFTESNANTVSEADFDLTPIDGGKTMPNASS